MIDRKTLDDIGRKMLRMVTVEHYHYCDDCKYKKVNWHDEPCNECAHGIKDRWEKQDGNNNQKN